MIRKEMTLAGRTLAIETGEVARQSDGSVMVYYGDTTVLVAVNAAKTPREDIDFFPLQVEYREKHYAGGKIPGGFFKREARPSEHEVLTSRLTDRPIRPLFPKGFKNETQVIITVLSSDGENLPDVLAGVGASAALSISSIPFNGPIATVRVGRDGDEFILNPTRSQMLDSDLELIVSGNSEAVVMVEGEADELPENIILDALNFAHTHIKSLIDFQNELVAACDVTKRELNLPEENTELKTAVLDVVGEQISQIVKIEDKHERNDAKSALEADTKESLAESFPEMEKDISSIIGDEFKAGFRERILAEGVRSDGRSTTDIRPITAKPKFLPRNHGSALFTRGETQALVVTTLGSKRDEMIVDSMDEDYKKNYYLHYNFPPYCVGETGRIGFTSRREIGHGNLAQRALKPVMPDYDDFPYTIRIVSEIMESNGSSSMASVCGGSLSMMSAGVPLREHVSGIAMGLITDGKRHAILSDILGMEDHLGDMDFKVTGSSQGITAIQLDLKIEGISFELLTEALDQAKEGRMHIIGIMDEAQPEASELSEFAPRILSLQINPEKIGALIGPGGKNIKKIIEDTECEVNVDDDGTVTVAGVDAAKCNDAIELVRAITFEPEVGMEFDGTVTRLMTFGAFVEFAPGREGLVHISEMDWKRTENVEDVCKPGDPMRIKLMKIDDQGRLDFSRKALMEKPEGWTPPPPRKPRDKRDGGRKPFKKRRF
ncbi:MAG: polyribonucleotide nucleotidyltransferase [Candidatus Marinimicrobia bacterium]|jgi:polyribonucleotide nucleotidyltransferase|nr:polyribonucleotide nucleotidyltransferase [Candidatus Neomarinimicrobiota bacterium]MBT3936292.1 polyribonucleotide nucleotidyltransferase [Candidatus Neomarinimicrobiota bacterium]MBT3961339.1 polyribonucleotide nucleotidyltransferase [Candidatus Neomarinimicrobiota bacterium]MBT4382939.1 polyribonucleotide nucleotidyltransferase [Candidatus Neomarinimicrobiota bacterium]MBT4637107.1 polyribonucleotide nucleotidyltransferase [Candidatus Neomarinimicrobiota bacterium]